MRTQPEADGPAAHTTTPPWHWPAPTTGSPAWTRLAQWTADGHHLLHGSGTAGLGRLEPRAPLDHSPDEYSKRTAVFATEDLTWAIAYAVRASDCPQFLNACFYPGDRPGTPAQRRLFFSYGRRTDGTVPVSPGVVYVVKARFFERQPPAWDVDLGQVITECQWTSRDTVDVVAAVRVTPADLHGPIPTHDSAEVSARMTQYASGFPWGAPDAWTPAPFVGSTEGTCGAC